MTSFGSYRHRSMVKTGRLQSPPPPLATSRTINASVGAVVPRLEALEGRRLMAVTPWSTSAQLIEQDQAAAHFPTLTGAGQTIAILDTGIDYRHPALGGRFGAGHK